MRTGANDECALLAFDLVRITVPYLHAEPSPTELRSAGRADEREWNVCQSALAYIRSSKRRRPLSCQKERRFDAWVFTMTALSSSSVAAAAARGLWTTDMPLARPERATLFDGHAVWVRVQVTTALRDRRTMDEAAAFYDSTR